MKSNYDSRFGWLAAILSLVGASGCSQATTEDVAQIDGGESVGEVKQFLNTTPGEGLYKIAPKLAPHKSFDIPGYCPGQGDGQAIQLWTYSDRNCEDMNWYIQYAGNDGQNYYNIREGGPNGRCLNIDIGNVMGGGVDNVTTWSCGNYDWQKWYFTETESMTRYGHWEIKSKYNGKVIDLNNYNTENGTDINVYNDNDNDAQRWILWPSGSGSAGMIVDFNDDFTSVDTNNWNKADWNAGFVNNEKQLYKPAKVSSDGRTLKLDARHYSGQGTGMGNYESGRINSKGKKWFRQGEFSFRAKYNEGGSLWDGGTHKAGTWAAGWLLGNYISEDAVYSQVNWSADCGYASTWPKPGSREIDIWEPVLNNWGNYFNAAHSGDGCQSENWSHTYNNGFDPNVWYVYSVVFDGTLIKYYRNGVLTSSADNSRFLNEDFNFVFNLAISGNLGGDSSWFNGDDDWAQLQVDWVQHSHWW